MESFSHCGTIIFEHCHFNLNGSKKFYIYEDVIFATHTLKFDNSETLNLSTLMTIIKGMENNEGLRDSLKTISLKNTGV